MPPSSRHHHDRRPRPDPAHPVDPRPGPAFAVEPRAGPADLPYPRIHDEALRFRAVVMDPRNEFDQTGCAWPRAPIDPADPLGQGELFTDDYRRLPTTKPSPPPPRANQSSGQSPPAPTSRPPTGRRRPRRPWRRPRPSHPLGSPRARRRPGACLRIFLKKAGFLRPIGPRHCLHASIPPR